MDLEENSSERFETIEIESRLPAAQAQPKRHILRRLELHVFAFSTCFAFTTFTAYFLLISLQCLLIGLWANLYHSLNVDMPKTFSWEVLVRMFGSIFNDCMDRSGPTAIRLTSYENCSHDFTMPPIPIISLFLLVGFLLSSVFYGIEKLFFDLSHLLLRTVYFFGILKVIFFVGAVTSIFVSYDNAQNNLQILMNEDLEIRKDIPHVSPIQIPPRWDLTQITHQCCGRTHFSEWKFGMFQLDRNPLYPRSCCNSSMSACKFYPNRSQVWQKGCFEPEYANVKDIALTAIYLLFVDFINTLLLVVLMTIVHTIHPGRTTFRIRLSKSLFTPKCKWRIRKSIKSSSESESTSTLNPNARSSSTPLNTEKLNVEVDMDLIKSYGTDTIDRQGSGDGDHAPNAPSSYNIVGNGTMDGNLENSSKLSKYNDLTVRRESDITFHVDTWGIHYKMQSSSITKTHVVKKETLV